MRQAFPRKSSVFFRCFFNKNSGKSFSIFVKIYPFVFPVRIACTCRPYRTAEKNIRTRVPLLHVPFCLMRRLFSTLFAQIYTFTHINSIFLFFLFSPVFLHSANLPPPCPNLAFILISRENYSLMQILYSQNNFTGFLLKYVPFFRIMNTIERIMIE